MNSPRPYFFIIKGKNKGVRIRFPFVRFDKRKALHVQSQYTPTGNKKEETRMNEITVYSTNT
ncbi:hypothetical protein SAMN05192533_103170 [Mesobacillus persicus]|uniref:Uncharacterized protein n=1 Tax=Mesobacillus persicus TaxID=930146 RepID=A0A1H7YX02_9BACI|nr:hypothetical protein SAMN05192533_103170 [Mesobacillus persicus]